MGEEVSIQQKIADAGFVLPPAPSAVGVYKSCVVSGSTAYLSGQIPKKEDGSLICGVLGDDFNLEQGQEAAQVAALNVLSLIEAEIGWERLKRILRVVGYVQCKSDFVDIPQVINGASELFCDVLGEKGKHSRSAVGVAALPLGVAVELEVTLEIQP